MSKNTMQSVFIKCQPWSVMSDQKRWAERREHKTPVCDGGRGVEPIGGQAKRQAGCYATGAGEGVRDREV